MSCVLYSRDTGLETWYPVLCIREKLDWRPVILCVYSRDTLLETRYHVLCIRETLDWRPDIMCCVFERHWTGDQISRLSLFGYSSAQANVGTMSHIKRRPTAFTSLAINRRIFSTLYNDIFDKKTKHILTFHLCLVDRSSSLMFSSVQAKILFLFRTLKCNVI